MSIYDEMNAFRIREATARNRQIINSANSLVSVSTNDILNQVIQQTTGETQETFRTIGRVYNRAIDQRWRQVVRIHDEVAVAAREASAERLRVNLKGRGPNMGYRSNAPGKMRRYAGGKLMEALMSPKMTIVTLDGVTFGNPQFLDTQAKQWARLNVGAGPRAGNTSKSSSVGRLYGAGDTFKYAGHTGSFFSTVVSDLDIPVSSGLSAKEAWVIPAGIWSSSDQFGNSDTRAVVASAIAPSLNRAGGDTFLPVSSVYAILKEARYREGGNRRAQIPKIQTRKVTRGVAGYGFLEAGMFSLARNLPAADMGFMMKIFEESTSEIINSIPNKMNISPHLQGNAISQLRSMGSAWASASGSGSSTAFRNQLFGL